MPVPDFTDRPINDLISLDGRVAVVTGGVQGTGLGIARRLGEAGATVVIADRDLDAARRTAHDLSEDRRAAIGVPLDPLDEGSIIDAFGIIDRDLGGLDVLVNNVGSYPSKPVTEITAAEWDAVLHENLRSAFLCAREAAKRMIEQARGGVIVNIESTAAFRAPSPGLAAYVSSKFGMRGLTSALGVELGPHGIRVLGVAPTFTLTSRTRERRPDLDDANFQKYITRVGRAKPLGRVGVPDDVGRVVLFCASDLSALMTGSTLAVDAGDLSGAN